MKRILLLLVTCFLALSIQAQNDSTAMSRPKVGLVLGGGGARGASHIGVIEYIEELGIPIDYVAGTSMGSILGGLYAMGYEPQEMTRLISNMDWSEYIGNNLDRTIMSEDARKRHSTLALSVPFGDGEHLDESSKNLVSQLPSAYVNNSSLVNLFNDLCVGYQDDLNFDDMPIPFACVATDLVTGQEVVLRKGNVAEAMRASMAIPGVFSPVVMGDYVLVDGGLVNNFPADVLRDMGADIIIGVEVTNESAITAEDLKSLPQVLGRLVTNGTSAKRKENRELCEVHIVPNVSGFGMLSFTPDAIETLVDRGYAKAAEYHEELMDIKRRLDAANGGPVSKELHALRARNLTETPAYINSITISGVTDRESKWLMRKGGLTVCSAYTAADIERAVNVYRGTGCFDEVTYNIKQFDRIEFDSTYTDAYALNFNVKPAKPHVLGVGLRYDTEEGAGVLLNVNFNAKDFAGSKLNLSAKLSYSPRVSIGYTYARPSLANFNIRYDYRDEHYKLWESGKSSNLHYLQHKITGSISQFHLLNISTEVGVSYMGTNYDRASVGEDNFYDSTFFLSNRLLVPYAMFRYDNLDDDYFAHQGIRAHILARYFMDMDDGTSRSFDVGYSFQYYITPKNGRFTIIPQFYGRLQPDYGMLYFNTWVLYGGEMADRHFEEQMPFVGINFVEYGLGRFSGIARCDFRYNFYGNHYITAMYNMSMDMEMIIKEYVYHGAGLKYSFNTVLGPISLTGQWSSITKRFGGYFSFGFDF